MNHWSEKYLGQAWTPQTDCYYWFRRIQAEQFGRTVPVVPLDHASGAGLVRSAARAILSDTATDAGWQPTDNPAEGDAVFLAQRTRPHHIGVAVMVTGALYVLHALEGVGVVVSDTQALRLNGWRIQEIWTYAG